MRLAFYMTIIPNTQIKTRKIFTGHSKMNCDKVVMPFWLENNKYNCSVLARCPLLPIAAQCHPVMPCFAPCRPDANHFCHVPLHATLCNPVPPCASPMPPCAAPCHPVLAHTTPATYRCPTPPHSATLSLKHSPMPRHGCRGGILQWER